MDKVMENLKGLGYTDKEAKIYISLLTLGKGSVQSVATQSGVKRPTVYIIIEALVENGLVSRVIGGKKRIYVALKPETLLAQTERLYTKVKECLPDLLSLVENKESKKVRTLYFEGISGIEKALWYKMNELKNTEIFAFFGTTDLATGEMVKIFHEWNEELAKNDIKLHSIAPKDRELQGFREKERDYGFLNKIIDKNKYSSKLSVDITEEFVRILFFKEKQALIIESKEFSATFKQIFKIVWGAI